MSTKIPCLILILVMSASAAIQAGKTQKNTAQTGTTGQKTSQKKAWSPKKPVTSASVPAASVAQPNSTTNPAGGASKGKIRYKPFAIHQTTDQSSPPLAPAVGEGKATPPAVSLSSSSVAQQNSNQTIKIGASRAEATSNQTVKVGTSRAETVSDQTTVGDPKRHIKSGSATTPVGATQASPDTPKKKKPAAPPHQH